MAKALHYGCLAGDAALRLHAPCAAIEHFTRSLQAAYHVTGSQPGLRVGRAARGGGGDPLSPACPGARHLGDFERARADLETALRLARAPTTVGRSGSPARSGITLAGARLRPGGRISSPGGRSGEDAGRRAVRGLAVSTSLATGWPTSARAPEAAAAHEEALTLFAALGDDQGTAETLDLLAIGTWLCFGDGPRAVALLERAAELYRTLGDVHGLISSHVHQAAFSQPLEIAPLFPPLRTNDDQLHTLMEALHWHGKSTGRQGRPTPSTGWAGRCLVAVSSARRSSMQGRRYGWQLRSTISNGWRHPMASPVC